MRKTRCLLSRDFNLTRRYFCGNVLRTLSIYGATHRKSGSKDFSNDTTEFSGIGFVSHLASNVDNVFKSDVTRVLDWVVLDKGGI